MTTSSKALCTQLPVLFLWLAAGLSNAAAETQAGDARQLLDEMTTASRTLNYDGVFVYQRGTQLDAMRIIHQANGNGERERLVALTGNAREVVRNDQSVTCIFPDDKAVLVEKSRPYKLLSSQIPQPVSKLADNYTFSITGQDRIASRSTWIVNILPRDQFRYGYRLWIDQQSKLLLKSELLDERGQPREKIMFTRIEIMDTIPEQYLKPTIHGANFTWYENADDMHNPSANSQWEVQWLPTGFKLNEHADELIANRPRPVNHMIFSDGLATVSIFVEKLDKQKGPMIGPSSVGAVNAFARQTDGHQVMVMGEVPLGTVRQMANSVAYSP